MRCPSHENLSAYVDRELPLSEMQKIETHLQDCLTCRIEVARLEKLIRKFNVLAETDLPIPNMYNPTISRKNYRWAAAAVVVLLVAGSAVFFGLRYNQSSVAEMEEELQYFYNNHKDYVRSQSTAPITLVSWE